MNFKIGIGMRYIKTALAVVLCIVISRGLGFDYPFFAAIAAVISMENTVTNSFLTGKNRVMGTLIGAGVGVVFAWVQPQNALLCGLGIILIIFICNVMQWSTSISIATIVFLAIMLNLDGSTPLIYGVNRIEDTLLGIAVALLVNYLIFPYDIAKQLIDGEERLREKIISAIDTKFVRGEIVDLDDLLLEITKLEAHYELHINEFRIGKRDHSQVEAIKDKLVVYRDFYAHLKMLVRLGGEPCLEPGNVLRLNALGYVQTHEGCRVEDDLNTVFNYHVGRILDDLEWVCS